MIKSFTERVNTEEGFNKEIHAIKVKLEFGVLERPEDSYMWPYLIAVWDKFGEQE